MDKALQISAICLIGAVLSLVVKRRSPEFAFCIAAGCCAMMLVFAAQVISPVIALVRQLEEMTQLNQALLAPLLKTVGIGLLTQIAGGFCLDAGEQSMARVVELCGTFLALCAALPLATGTIQMIQTVMGG